MQKTKGFTIIELIVVIAIIAVLAAIVMVNVTGYITKGKDAAAQGNLATMITNGAVFYDTNSTFTGFNTGAQTGTAAANTPASCVGNTGWVSGCQALTGPSGGAGGYTVTWACGNGTATVPTNCNTAGVTNWCAQITLK